LLVICDHIRDAFKKKKKCKNRGSFHIKPNFYMPPIWDIFGRREGVKT